MASEKLGVCTVLCCCSGLRMVKNGGGVWREKGSKPACVAEAVEPKLNKWNNGLIEGTLALNSSY